MIIRKSFACYGAHTMPLPSYELVPVVKDVSFGDDVVKVTTFVKKLSKHPIPMELKSKMYDVEHSNNAQLIDSNFIHESQTDAIYNGYLALVKCVNSLAAAPAPAVAPAVAPAAAPASAENVEPSKIDEQ